jgi:branched-chain amino acid transport system permease protein
VPDWTRLVPAPVSEAWSVVATRAERAYGSVPNMARLMLLALLLIGVPFYENPLGGGVIFDDRWLAVFRLVGLYIMLGIGLNVVVGYAGLLDLGYVAFFATGAYLYALLASPASPAIDFPIEDVPWLFWAMLPGALVVGAFVGVLLGIPVLPLRGDYLAIVTLGFGEIIRLFLINQTNLTGGSQGLYGIRAPPLPEVPVINLTDLKSTALTEWYIFLVIGVFVAAFCAGRLRDSRIGRAWEAIREDEEVASAMGVNTIKYKLLAFAMGASLGSLGGTIFAAFQGSALPDSFDLLVSINVVSLVVIGGMGNTTGVVLGAVILIGIPDFLRFREASDLLGFFDPVVPFADTHNWAQDLRDNRFMVFGLLLVIVMVLRPVGLIPSRRRKLEFALAEETAETT